MKMLKYAEAIHEGLQTGFCCFYNKFVVFKVKVYGTLFKRYLH